MKKGKITVAGIGPGSREDITPAVQQALSEADVVVGYHYYFEFVREMLRVDAVCVDTGMKRECERAELALQHAADGARVCVISSGDAGIYGMAPLIYEMMHERGWEIPVEVLPGISAFQKAASLLGAPVGHDFCVISLSDLMTPWEKIESRVQAAAQADFVTALYNPRSRGRYWQLPRVLTIFRSLCKGETPVGIVRQAGRADQEVSVTTLAEFDPARVDMFTVVLIGNSQSYCWGEQIITPRGYYKGEEPSEDSVGRRIMTSSFAEIHRLLRGPNIPLDRKWVLLHCIHTTADFEMEKLLYSDSDVIARWNEAFRAGRISTIITDVTMARAGIRKGALERLGVTVKCYLEDPRTEQLAVRDGITRTQAGIRLAVEEHPEGFYVFGNAPTALIELCNLMQSGKATPAGVVGAPVGFVHVEESKYRLASFGNCPKVIIQGRKGGSNLAATIVNAVLTFEEAEALHPGGDL